MSKISWLIPVLITAIAGLITIFPFLYGYLSEHKELLKVFFGIAGILVSMAAGVFSFLIARRRRKEAGDD